VAYFVIVRGPLGVGKTTVAVRLAQRVGVEHISIDQILEEHDLEEWEDGFVSLRSFVRANEYASELGRAVLASGRPAIFDGNFYHEGQVDDLVGRLRFRHSIFSLQAPLAVCVERDGLRRPPHGAEATKDVYAKTASFERGIGIDATLPVETIVNELVSHLPRG
jgi:predicted kinase